VTATTASLTNPALCTPFKDREDVAAAREALRKARPTLDPKRLTFIDETAATTKMTRQGSPGRTAG
jgi:hypothetical protein